MGLISRVADRLGEMSAAAPSGPLKAVWNGVVLAESDRTVKLEGNHYFPPDSLNREYFVPSTKRTVCPRKGTATYLSIEAGDERNEAAAWTYPNPSRAADEIRDHVAFWHGVKVVAA